MMIAGLSLCSLVANAEARGLDQFNVSIKGYDVTLTWITHSSAAQTFEVQVATEADNKGDLLFLNLAELPAGTTSEYEFTDNSPSKEGIRYYRVKQTERDGSVTFSETKTANFQSSDNFTLSVTPALDFNTIDLDVTTTSAATATVTLTSLVATFNQTSTVDVVSGTATHKIQVDPKAPTGPYLLSFEMNGAVQLRLITKDTSTPMTVNN